MKPELHQRWTNSKCVVIGCSYNIEEISFWQLFDSSYIGIGMGHSNFKDDPFNEEDWNNNGYWENDVIKPYYGQFETVYLDRCVWNCLDRVFLRMLKFVAKLLKPNGKLYIPYTNWNEALHFKLSQMFHDAPINEGYAKSDIDNVNVMIESKLFRLGSSVKYEIGSTCHRYKWQLFYKK
jgi:hypothetical protein